jgi:hypothetical protein
LPQLVREPTALELMVANRNRRQAGLDQPIARQPIARQPVQRAIAKSQADAGEMVGAAVAKLIDDPILDAATVAAELAADCPNGEARIREWYQKTLANVGKSTSAEANLSIADDIQRHDAQIHAALKLLLATATTDSLPVLEAALSEERDSRDVLPVVARLSSVEKLVWHVQHEAWPGRQITWLASLLERGTPAAVTAYLDFAADPQTAQTALDAIEKVRHPPVDELFSALTNSRRVPVRLAAARVLGAMNDEKVTTRLVQMAVQNVNRREALAALVSSNNPAARKFVAFARGNTELASTLFSVAPRMATPVVVN